METLLLLLCLFQSSSSLARNQVELEGRIVNGIPISASLYPWMVSLRQDVIGINNSFCGGSLIHIDPAVVLTAAHCLKHFRYNASDGTIRNNYNYINKLYADINRTYPQNMMSGDKFETLTISISQIYMHPKYNANLLDGYDIALIIFDDNQTVDISIDPLPTIQEELSLTGESLKTIGYGKNATGGMDTFSLEETILNYVSVMDCANALKAVSNISIPESLTDQSFLCVMGNDTNICKGDSGGPLFRCIQGNQVEIIGVASFFIGGCNEYPSAFTSVAHYHDWVMKTIEFHVNGVTYLPTTDPTENPTTNKPTPVTSVVNPADDEVTKTPTSEPAADDGKQYGYFCSTMISVLFVIYTIYKSV